MERKQDKVAKVVAKGVRGISTYGAETRCLFLFHDVKKPEALKKLKRY